MQRTASRIRSAIEKAGHGWRRGTLLAPAPANAAHRDDQLERIDMAASTKGMVQVSGTTYRIEVSGRAPRPRARDSEAPMSPRARSAIREAFGAHALACVASCLVWAACAPPRFPPVPPRMPPIAAADEPVHAAPPSCVRFWPEARYRNYGYDHVVHLNSRCHRTASCSVSTDVNPKVIAVAVAPGEHVEVVTFRGSPMPEFTAIVECSRGTR
jgi:hypothetical protein